jgi:hypothetical protein
MNARRTPLRHEPRESYAGPATIDESAVEVDLKGYFEAIDGRFHWYGRISASDTLAARAGDEVVLATRHGSARGKLSDLDPWGRFRITGTGTPPF